MTNYVQLFLLCDGAVCLSEDFALLADALEYAKSFGFTDGRHDGEGNSFEIVTGLSTSPLYDTPAENDPSADRVAY